MRTTIWIPDEVAKDIKEEAWRRHKSLSSYLVGLHAGNMVPTRVIPLVKEVSKKTVLSELKEKVESIAPGAVFFKPHPKGGKK